jgi:hypothetical protein
MNQRTIILAAVCAALSLAAGAAEPVDILGRTFVPTADGWVLQDGAAAYPVEPGTVSVRFAPAVADLAGFREALRVTGGDAELGQLQPIRINRLGIHDLALLTTQDPVDIAVRLNATGLVEFAEPTTIGTYGVLPNDPSFDDQWHLRNIGQTGGSTDADVDAD